MPLKPVQTQCQIFETYQILNLELFHPVKSFDEKLYICETCHKHLYKNKIPYRAVYNKMALDHIPEDFKKFRKNPNFQKNFV